MSGMRKATGRSSQVTPTMSYASFQEFINAGLAASKMNAPKTPSKDSRRIAQ